MSNPTAATITARQMRETTRAANRAASAVAHQDATAAARNRTPTRRTEDNARRLDHPSPLTAADRAALASMPYLADTGDLDQIPVRYRSRALRLLKLLADGKRTADAMAAAGMVSWERSYCRRFSNTYRTAYDAIIEARCAEIVERTMQTLTDLANGEYKPKKGCAAPDTRAASILLPALDSRFRGNVTGGQSVQINISI